ncbi:MAG: substrate-binding domain-containing protein [Anaerolineales bacterium]
MSRPWLPNWVWSRSGRDGKEAGGYQAANVLLALCEKPTALVASQDEMAMAAMNAINPAGLRVPGDVSVLGVDPTLWHSICTHSSRLSVSRLKG